MKRTKEEVKVNAEVTRAKETEWGCFFDLVVNGVTIYGCRVVEGSKGDFISFPSRKNEKDGKYYNHAYIKLSDEDTKDIIAQVEKLI